MMAASSAAIWLEFEYVSISKPPAVRALEVWIVRDVGAVVGVSNNRGECALKEIWIDKTPKSICGGVVIGVVCH